MHSFNLMDQPWISVRKVDGEIDTVSILKLFENSKSYSSLATELPLTDFALLRILLAILHRSWVESKAENLNDALNHWEEKWKASSLLDTEVVAYSNKVHDRFDIMDSVTPFFQVANLHTSNNEWKPISLLFPDVAEPGSLFTMATDLRAATPALAARMLITTMAWDFSGIKSGAVGDPRVKGGRGYPIGTGWAGWIGATIVEGRNLHETILLNYIAMENFDGQSTHETDEDLPPWEKTPLDEKPVKSSHYSGGLDAENFANGPIELFTWQQRRIRIKWNNGQAVGCLVANGDPVGHVVQHGVEQMTPWRFSEPQSKKYKTPRYMPFQLQQGRALWRSLNGILPNNDPPKVQKGIGQGSDLQRPASTVSWISVLLREEILAETYPIHIRMMSMEYGANSSSYANIIADHISVPSALLNDEQVELQKSAQLAVSMTDRVAYALIRYYKNLRAAVGQRELSDAEVEDVRSRFYSEVDPEFRKWLLQLEPGVALDEQMSLWQQFLKRLAREVASNLLSQQSLQVWHGRLVDDKRINAATAEKFLGYALSEAIGKELSKQDLSGESNE
ncbi:type I-E CRISPR-associated protein Cse1/CasA [Corynebacterium dentalis]|uniref:type I-E CRISPR-associated protein Cse1/CasA n=1 Tax=Corynebacterium dentalis TaxID=2014528 RepID=UPI000C06E924|nr:type I-E CRISPR-associated protein Cse1/CasA [Corynebacterium dentalis]